MMRILIVDDEPPARRRIRALLAGIPDVEVVGESGNGPDAIAAIRGQKPDVVFLDIQMPELDGFAVVEACDAGTAPLFIFVTAYDEHAIRAFEVNALDYLLKPFDQDRFHEALRRARDQIARGEAAQTSRKLLALLGEIESTRKGEERIAIRESGRTVFLPVRQIDWIESAGNYVTIHAGSKTHVLRETMKGMEQRLGSRTFRRIHRHIIVNLARVSELHPWHRDGHVLILRDGTKLAVSRRYRHNLQDDL